MADDLRERIARAMHRAVYSRISMADLTGEEREDTYKRADAAILAAGWTPPGERVKPSVEAVARVLFDAEYHDIDAPERDIEWRLVTATGAAQQHGTPWHRQARAVLALLPGRPEAEVRAEALREAQDELVRRDAFTERSLRVLDELIEKGEGRG